MTAQILQLRTARTDPIGTGSNVKYDQRCCRGASDCSAVELNHSTEALFNSSAANRGKLVVIDSTMPVYHRLIRDFPTRVGAPRRYNLIVWWTEVVDHKKDKGRLTRNDRIAPSRVSNPLAH
jgi:hypothetical protein